MADYYSLCIIGLMDRLWFHQIVLFSQSTASVAPKPVKTSLLISESLYCSSVILPPDGEETSTNEPLSPENEISSESTSLTSQDDSNKEEGHREGHQIVNLAGNRVRSHSLSSSAPDHHMKFRKPATARRPQKSISYRTQGELELEEVKGFMDLGFIFKKENVSARMMNVVPGLQRLSMHHNNDDEELMDAPKAVEDGRVEKEGAERSITRPYLSEAWLIKRPDSQLLILKIPRRPDSQLLNLKIPRLCSTEDMKKRLRELAGGR